MIVYQACVITRFEIWNSWSKNNNLKRIELQFQIRSSHLYGSEIRAISKNSGAGILRSQPLTMNFISVCIKR